MSDGVLCPTCGWTGFDDDLRTVDDTPRCPACNQPIRAAA